MNFQRTDEDEASYAAARRFARDHLQPDAPTQVFPGSEAWRAAAMAGYTGASLPADQGGAGMSALNTARLFEALGRGSRNPSAILSLSAHLFACAGAIAAFGTDRQRRLYLPALAAGTSVGANAATEAEAGSDVHAMRTLARREGDEYVLNGVKNYVTNGPCAQLILVFAATAPEHGHLGLSAFVVEAGLAGARFGEAFESQSLTGAPACSLYLEDCRVPAQARLGDEGDGARIFAHSMQWERACLFAGYVGLIETQIEAMLDYARTRKQFGRAIGRNQAVSHRIVDLHLRLEAARLLLYRGCDRLDHGQSTAADMALAKLAISELAIDASVAGMQLHGSTGLSEELGFARELRDAVPATIFSGTSEMQREIIAAELGL